jgi:hypothetical protein
MSGWHEKGYVAAVGSTTATPLTLGQGQTSGTVTLWFPSKDPFKGWDSQAQKPFENSVCLIVYAVNPNGTPAYHVLYSDVLGLIVNTVNES